VVFLIVTFGIMYMLQVGIEPQVSQQVALGQVSDTNAGHAAVRAYEGKSNLIRGDLWYVMLLAIGLWLFKPWRAFKAKEATPLAVMALLALMATGCMKPYDKPEYEEVSNNETAFVVPLEGASADGAKLDSENALDKFKVMTKRIQITKRWNQTGRLPNSGDWIPMVKVIKVDRSPLTREWCADQAKGTGKKDEAIWVESSDSIGFSTGFNCTAYVAEKDTALFLYWYPNTALTAVMDTEIRTRIQQVVAEVANKYIMDELRAKKAELIAAIREDVIPFYEKRGISITAVGQYGGFTYENPAIQTAIDDVFVAQQEKAKEKSLLEAMGSKKTRMMDEGTAIANQKREEAKGQADGALTVKEAEAKGIKLVNDALKEAQGNPLFVQIKALEVESERIKKWDGTSPVWITGDGAGFVPMIQTPPIEKKPAAPAAPAAAAK
jgi:regulator of protease activity HflC (stomatin/prohibitin superfamily)